eukprot:6182520-Pleurochrysis_carterae.AAC.1
MSSIDCEQTSVDSLKGGSASATTQKNCCPGHARVESVTIDSHHTLNTRGNSTPYPLTANDKPQLIPMSPPRLTGSARTESFAAAKRGAR